MNIIRKIFGRKNKIVHEHEHVVMRNKDYTDIIFDVGEGNVEEVFTQYLIDEFNVF